jgi:hypothetical protein
VDKLKQPMTAVMRSMDSIDRLSLLVRMIAP